MQLEQMAHESDIEYHRRIVYGKLVDKTLADIDYSELSELVYGQAYSSDVARRMMYGSKKTLELLEQDAEGGISSDSLLSELENKRMELVKERTKFFDQRREYHKLMHAEGRMEHLEERLVAAAQHLSETVGRQEYCEASAGGGESEAVLVLCDWHYGMTARNVWNAYNTEICKQRIAQVVAAAAERVRLHNCRRLRLLVLGDLINGAIHTSSRVASEELVCDQIMQVAELLAQAVEYLSQYVDETIVYTTYGNHARTVQEKKESFHRDNMERIIPWWLKERLKECRDVQIVSDFENEFIFFDVCGYGICATHGDLDSVKASPRLLTVLFQKKFGKNVDYILLADKHHRESFEELSVPAMICGALCGTDEFANNKRLYSTPEQTLLIVKDGVGVDAEYHLRCG